MDGNEPLSPPDRQRWRWILLWGVGMAAMLAVIVATTFKVQARWSDLALGVGVNALLLAVAVVIGGLTAPRCGLTSWVVHGWPASNRVLRSVAVAAVLGVGGGAAIAGVDAALFAHLPSFVELTARHEEVFRKAAEVSAANLVVRFAYGGVVEELLLRWCVMSLLAWGLVKLGVSRTPAVVAALLLSATLFGVAHLPAALHLLPDAPTAFLARTVALNTVAGLLFGAVYARASLEAGMVCHAATHLGLLLSSTTAL